MSDLKRAFALLDGFSSLSPDDQHDRILALERFLSSAEKKRQGALLALREIDQLRKERAHLLVSSGQVELGIKEIDYLVAQYEEFICALHEEAGFQLAEASVALFRSGRSSAGRRYAESALAHAGMAKRVSSVVLAALDILQARQAKERNRRKGSPRKTE